MWVCMCVETYVGVMVLQTDEELAPTTLEAVPAGQGVHAVAFNDEIPYPTPTL